ncbi:LicD family protein [Treponema pectinovorum]|uniref:LicD family protein n=1 Tax=Treponema pectinovorum TaxID=164 RepID=UPI0011F3C2AC|nr:LicD family protein [Treponema pectinovorum]
MTYKELVNTIEEKGLIRPLNSTELEELKKIMLLCFTDVFRVCLKHNINVLLGGGSALGAVRHKGFIPWDDDLDLMMSRADFDKFKEIFDNELGKKYILNSPNFSLNPSNRFPKVLVKGTKFVEAGEDWNKDSNKIKIDIFIIENVPDFKIHRLLHGFLCSLVMYIASCVDIFETRNSDFSRLLLESRDGKKLLKKRMIIGRLFSFKRYGKWCDAVDSLCQYNKKSKCVSIPTGRRHYFGEMLPREVFFPPKKCEFEGLDAFIPNLVERYLSNLYGEYMIIPPESKREKHLIKEISFNI